MSESEISSANEPNKLRNEVQEQLREDGLDELAEFVNGPTRINQLDVHDFIQALDEDYALRLRNDDEEIHFAMATTGDLVQTRDGDRDGNFGRSMGVYRGELADYIFSGQYSVELTFPEETAFEVVEA